MGRCISKLKSSTWYLSSGRGQVRRHQQSPGKRCGSATPTRCPIRRRQATACQKDVCQLKRCGSETPPRCPIRHQDTACHTEVCLLGKSKRKVWAQLQNLASHVPIGVWDHSRCIGSTSKPVHRVHSLKGSYQGISTYSLLGVRLRCQDVGLIVESWRTHLRIFL